MELVDLGNECGLSDGKVQEVVELLSHARLLYHNILLVCLCFLDDIKVENRMTTLNSLDGFFWKIDLSFEPLTQFKIDFA